MKPAIITKNKTLISLIFEPGYSPEKLTVYTTTNSFITGDVFFQWLTVIFIPHVEATMETLRRLLGTFNERAVLILDGCSCHTNERFQQFLESKNITMMFLVSHSSHLAQPLDLGVYGRVKRVLRDSATYALNVEELNDALDDVLDGVVPHEAAPQRPRTERGKVLAEYVLSILDAYEKATTRRLIVSAFKRAGIRYMIPDPQSPERAVAYVDPTEARAVKKNVIILHGIAPVDRPPRGQIRVSDLILNGQMREEGGEGQTESQRVGETTLTRREQTAPGNQTRRSGNTRERRIGAVARQGGSTERADRCASRPTTRSYSADRAERASRCSAASAELAAADRRSARHAAADRRASRPTSPTHSSDFILFSASPPTPHP